MSIKRNKRNIEQVYLEGNYNIIELLTIAREIAKKWENHETEFYWNDDLEIVWNCYKSNTLEEITLHFE